jgi:hypothetical protein
MISRFLFLVLIVKIIDFRIIYLIKIRFSSSEILIYDDYRLKRLVLRHVDTLQDYVLCSYDVLPPKVIVVVGPTLFLKIEGSSDIVIIRVKLNPLNNRIHSTSAIPSDMINESILQRSGCSVSYPISSIRSHPCVFEWKCISVPADSIWSCHCVYGFENQFHALIRLSSCDDDQSIMNERNDVQYQWMDTNLSNLFSSDASLDDVDRPFNFNEFLVNDFNVRLIT